MIMTGAVLKYIHWRIMTGAVHKYIHLMIMARAVPWIPALNYDVNGTDKSVNGVNVCST